MPRTRVPELRGSIRRYAVGTIAEVDTSLRELPGWLTQQIAAAPRFGIEHIRAFRGDQDQLLDARFALMRQRDGV